MKEDWVKIYSSHDLIQVKLAEDILKQNSIVSHILEHPNSAMPMLGEAALYAKPENAERALAILAEHELD